MTEIVTYYLSSKQPELHMKKRIIIYYFSNSDLATELALKERAAKNVAYTRDASAFIPADVEACESVVILPDVPEHYKKRIEDAYGNRVKTEAVSIASEKLIEGAAERDINSTEPTELPVKVAPADFQMMTRKELIDYAETNGIKVEKNCRRDDLIAALQTSV